MKNKAIIPIALSAVFIGVSSMAVAYGTVKLAGLPISLPFMATEEVGYYPEIGLSIAQDWENVVVYEKPVEPEPVVDKKTLADILSEFVYLDGTSLESYLSNHQDLLANGYEKINIDLADKNNTPSGIKTTKGDDVLTLDTLNGISIIGRNITNSGKTYRAKLVVVNQAGQLDLSVVDDLNYWSSIESHAKNSNALLALNANGYNWNTTGSYATLVGGCKLHGELIRKPNIAEHIISIDASGNISLTGAIDNSYSAIEYGPELIKENKIVYQGDDKSSMRMAQSAIGQTSDGKLLLVQISGGIYGSNEGGTYADVLKIMQDYGAVNASMLSGGSRSVLYWNGRILSNHLGYAESGVLLPNALVIKHA